MMDEAARLKGKKSVSSTEGSQRRAEEVRRPPFKTFVTRLLQNQRS